MAKPIEARVVAVAATEIKPGHNYLLCVNKDEFREDDLEQLFKGLKRMGMGLGIAMMVSGDPTTAVQVIEKEISDGTRVDG